MFTGFYFVDNWNKLVYSTETINSSCSTTILNFFEKYQLLKLAAKPLKSTGIERFQFVNRWRYCIDKEYSDIFEHTNKYSFARIVGRCRWNVYFRIDSENYRWSQLIFLLCYLWQFQKTILYQNVLPISNWNTLIWDLFCEKIILTVNVIILNLYGYLRFNDIE